MTNSPVKVLYSECSGPSWLEIAKKLYDVNGWDPIYWISVAQDAVPIKQAFPNIIFHDRLDAIRGVPHPDFAGLNLEPLDETILRDMAFQESQALKMMDRMDPNDLFTYPERVRLYHELLKYWRGVLKHIQPGLVVFPVAPHVIYDYVLYSVCQYLGIKTVMFERSSIPGLVFAVETVEDGSSCIAEAYRSKLASNHPAKVELSPETEAHFVAVKGDYSSATPFYARRNFKILEQLRRRGSLASNIQRMISRVVHLPKTAYTYLALPAPSNYLKERGKNIEDSDMGGMEWRLNRRAANRTKQRLERYYNDLVEAVDLQEPYVYVSLSYQPEKTTSPSGGTYVHLRLMVDVLSEAIPEGWSLYVKEFPFQLKPFKMGERSRANWFYDDLVSMPNVKLVPLDMSPFPLIDNAKAVATVTGNAGWESVVRGKPALVFGYPWYRHCEGVFYTPTLESCREAVSQITGGYKVDHEKVRLFAQTLEEVCFKGYLDPIDQAATGLSHEDNVQGFSQALTEFWQGLPDSPETDAQQQAAGSPVSEPSFRN